MSVLFHSQKSHFRLRRIFQIWIRRATLCTSVLQHLSETVIQGKGTSWVPHVRDTSHIATTHLVIFQLEALAARHAPLSPCVSYPSLCFQTTATLRKCRTCFRKLSKLIPFWAPWVVLIPKTQQRCLFYLKGIWLLLIELWEPSLWHN